MIYTKITIKNTTKFDEICFCLPSTSSAAKNIVREGPVNDVVSRWRLSHSWKLIQNTSKNLSKFVSGWAMASWPHSGCATVCHQLVDAWRSFANSTLILIMLRYNRNSGYRKIYLFRNNDRYVKWKAVNPCFCGKMEVTRVPPERPSRTTSGTRTAGWEPLCWRV